VRYPLLATSCTAGELFDVPREGRADWFGN
jgi:hypothetical protein